MYPCVRRVRCMGRMGGMCRIGNVFLRPRSSSSAKADKVMRTSFTLTSKSVTSAMLFDTRVQNISAHARLYNADVAPESAHAWAYDFFGVFCERYGDGTMMPPQPGYATTSNQAEHVKYIARLGIASVCCIYITSTKITPCRNRTHLHVADYCY